MNIREISARSRKHVFTRPVVVISAHDTASLCLRLGLRAKANVAYKGVIGPYQYKPNSFEVHTNPRYHE